LRRADSLALPPSWLPLRSPSLSRTPFWLSTLVLIIRFFDFYFHLSSSSFSVPVPSDSFPPKQSFWDRPGVLRDRSSVEGSLADSEQLARLLAAAAQHSGDWLLALLITSGGLRLDDESVHVAISTCMCLGINLCEPHVCRGCGSQVDARGLHCFICKHAPGRTARHQSFNDVVSTAIWQTVDVGSDSGSHSGKFVCEPDFTSAGAAAELAASRK